MSLESFKTDFLISFAWVGQSVCDRESEWEVYKREMYTISEDYISENVFHGLLWMRGVCVWMNGWWCWNDGDDNSHVRRIQFFHLIITKSFSELIDLVGSAQSAYCFVCRSKNRLSCFSNREKSDHFPSSAFNWYALICHTRSFSHTTHTDTHFISLSHPIIIINDYAFWHLLDL